MVPTKDDDADGCDYVFKHWATAEGDILTPETVCTGDATYMPVFESTPNSVTITWANDDGTPISTSVVPYGDVPVYEGTPYRPSDVQFDYRFVGWTPEPVAATGDATYTAVFEEVVRMYEVKFYGHEVISLPYGALIEDPGLPDSEFRSSYCAQPVGWHGFTEGMTVTGNTDFNPRWDVRLIGDVNNDRSVNMRDYNVLRTLISNEGDYLASADINGDHRMNVRDLVSMKMLLTTTGTLYLTWEGDGRPTLPLPCILADIGGTCTIPYMTYNGAVVLDVLVDGVSMGASDVIEVVVTGDHDVHVVFETVTTYTLTVEAEGGGSVEPWSSDGISEGTEVEPTFTSGSGHVVSDVSVDGVSRGPVTSTVLTMTSDSIVYVLFSPTTAIARAAPSDGGR